jgi:hypothetical protein
VTAWREITLPAVDPSRGGDGSLWPSRWNRTALDVRRAEVGEHDWQSLFQQNPVAKRGRVYPNFARGTHVVRHEDLERQFLLGGRWSFRRRTAGVDFGWTHPGAMIVFGMTGAGCVYALHEEWHRHLLVAERTDERREGWLAIYKRVASQFQLDSIHADPSEPGNIAAMRQHLGGNPVVYNAQNDVGEGIRRIATLMAPHKTDGKPRFFVSDRCKRLIHELETYSYVGGSERPQEIDDDAADGARYGAFPLAA